MSEATERLEATLARMPLHNAGRLSHADKCGAFYALYRGFPKSLVAKAFGITPTTASHLAHCLAPRPGAQTRYDDIAREFRTLGASAFGERYYTAEIDDRIARIRADAPTADDAKHRRFGPSETHNAYEGYFTIPTIDGGEAIVRVHWAQQGWTYSEITPDSWTAPVHFRSSGKALMDAFNNYGQDCPSPLPQPRAQP
jgi:hypothetical protein